MATTEDNELIDLRQLKLELTTATPPLEVLSSQRGFYLGTRDEDGLPNSRESVEYWPTKDEATTARDNGNWELRGNESTYDLGKIAEAMQTVNKQERALSFADHLEQLADQVEAKGRAARLERGQSAADELGKLADQVEARTHNEGLQRGRAAADELEKLADAVELRAAQMIATTDKTAGNDEAQRAQARADVQALHEIHNPALLDATADVINSKMQGNKAYEEEFSRVDGEAARAVQMLARDGATFDAEVAQRATMTIDDVTFERLEAARERDRSEALRILGADAGDVAAVKEQDKPAQDERTDKAEEKDAGVPLAVRKRFLNHEDKFFYRDAGNALAFEDQGKKLTTPTNDPEVARAMVDTAIAKGWEKLVLKGTDEFKREAWLQATVKGVEVKGYEPQPADLARLADMKTEHARTEGHKNDNRTVNAIERGRAQEVVREEPTAAARVIDETREVTKGQRTAIDALAAIMRDRGDSEQAITAATQVASERFQTARVYVGKVVEHGAAPYENKPENERSYYVKLETEQGEKTVWGKDLARAMEESGVQKGQEVAVAFQGSKQVEVPVKKRDENGKVVGQGTIITNRNTWEVKDLSKLRDEVREELQSRSKLADKEPAVKVYDNAASKAPRVVQMPEKQRAGDRARG